MLIYKFKFAVYALMLCTVHSLMEWGSWRQPVAYDTNARRQTLLAHASGYTHQGRHDSLAQNQEDDDAVFPGQKKINTIIPVNRMWPPWPFHLLQKRPEQEDDEITAANTYPSAASLLIAFCRQRALVFIRQCQEIGSQLWFHLPPAAPPLILLAGIPRTVVIENQQSKVVPMFSVPFCRNLVLAGFGLAVMSWAHMELHRKRKLAPLSIPFDRVSSVFLPPFLPAEVPEPELDALDTEEQKTAKGQNATTISTTTTESSEENSVINLVGPKIRRFYSDLYENAPRPSIFRELKRKRTQRKREAAKIRRLSIFDELVALQALKRKSKRLSNQNKNLNSPQGYALVTGASQGIGRAIAVELARWEIPLILVARDMSRLISLAYDLEACYGVKCCVLSADLSEIDAAERIHDTTQKAGLTVDILVNNAGIALEGLAVDASIQELERMMMVNTMSFAKLSNLYGQDMKRRRRGRVLMVSSMSGLTSSSANCGLYGATKAFEKSLAFSMAKELEPYGVGVTCLLPGPVTDTKFRDRSGTGRALCWYVPFYPKSPKAVAHLGVMGVLDGDVQVIPGWQNRLFAKLLRPVIPQRFETMIVQAAWTPFRWRFGRRKEEESGEAVDLGASRQDSEISLPQVPLDLKPRYSFQMPPMMLELPKKEDAQPPQPQQQPAEATAEEDNSPVESDGNEANEGMKTKEDTRVKTMPEELTPSELSPVQHVEPEPNSDVASEGANETDEESKLSEGASPADAEVLATDQDQHTAVSPNSDEIPQPEISKDEMKQDEKQPTPGETKEGSRVGTTLNRNERKFSEGINVFGSDNDDEDDNESGMSPKLGPVDLFQNRKYVLPKSNQTLPATEHLSA